MTEQLEDALLGDGFERGRFAMRGSSVTGRKFDRITGLYDGPPFDTRKRSDWDLALVDENLFKYVLRHARQERIDIRGGRTRTDWLGPVKLKRLGLYDLTDKIMELEKASGRQITIAIFKHADALRERGPAMWLKRR